MPSPGFAVAICTRNRPQQLTSTLAALLGQSRSDFEILVVDQSDEPDRALERTAIENGRLTILRDPGRGLSRARNLASQRLAAEWIVFVDDDCVVGSEWAARLADELTAHPDVDFVSGHVGARGQPGGDYRPVTTYRVERPHRRSGRWTRPDAIGFGVCMAVRRSMIDAVGGWDERLGPGVAEFPASDDMDFNYRLLRAGGVAYATPRVRSEHDQWRRHEDLAPLWRGYMAAWAAFSVKQLKTGDVTGGAWLWVLGLTDTTRVLIGALRRRSGLNLRIALARFAGYAGGTRKALARRW